MLAMSVKIFQKDSLWILEVNCPNDGGKVYHFKKGEFKSAFEAKSFFYEHIKLFVVHMGQV